MSLIQEALKRQQEENEGIAPPLKNPGIPEKNNVPPQPSAAPKRINIASDHQTNEPPPEATINPIFLNNAQSDAPPKTVPAPDASPQQATTAQADSKTESDNKSVKKSSPKAGKKESRKPITIVLIILLIGAICAVIIFALSFLGINMPWSAKSDTAIAGNSTENSTEQKIAEKVETPAAKTDTTTSAPQKITASNSTASDSTTKQTVSAAKNKVTAAKTATETAEQSKKNDAGQVARDTKNNTPAKQAASTEQVSPSPVAAVAAAKPKPQTKTTAQPKTDRNVVKKAPPAPKQPVIWPTVKIKGIVGRGKNGAVMLNDQIVSIGGEIDGIKITRISSRGVWLEYKGEKRFGKVGSTIQ